jgi:hypothetical protein
MAMTKYGEFPPRGNTFEDDQAWAIGATREEFDRYCVGNHAPPKWVRWRWARRRFRDDWLRFE